MQQFPLLIIPTFNNPTYLNLMLTQLGKMRWGNYLVIDSGSSYPVMLKMLEGIPTNKKLILESNLGPRYFSENRKFFLSLPDIFCVSDPDLAFNKNLPDNFVDTLIEISIRFKIGKIGFALDIAEELEIKNQEYILEGSIQTIRQYEKKYWMKPVRNSLDLEIYDAPIDTTFALYNKQFFKPEKSFTKAYRIAGAYTAIHLPWLNPDPRPTSEADFYNSLNKSGAFHDLDGMHLRLMQEIEDLRGSLSWRITKPLRGIDQVLKKVWKF
jgi:hypothetical protein